MPLTVPLLLMSLAIVIGLVLFLALAGRQPLSLRIALALSAPALAALQLFLPWNASPTWQWGRTLFSVGFAILLVVSGYFGLRESRTLLLSFLVPGVFGVGVPPLTAEEPLFSKAFWVGDVAPGRNLVFFSALAMAVLASWLRRRRERRAGH